MRSHQTTQLVSLRGSSILVMFEWRHSSLFMVDTGAADAELSVSGAGSSSGWKE